jgi:hypothetical protein
MLSVNRAAAHCAAAPIECALFANAYRIVVRSLPENGVVPFALAQPELSRPDGFEVRHTIRNNLNLIMIIVILMTSHKDILLLLRISGPHADGIAVRTVTILLHVLVMARGGEHSIKHWQPQSNSPVACAEVGLCDCHV